MPNQNLSPEAVIAIVTLFFGIPLLLIAIYQVYLQRRAHQCDRARLAFDPEKISFQQAARQFSASSAASVPEQRCQPQAVQTPPHFNTCGNPSNFRYQMPLHHSSAVGHASLRPGFNSYTQPSPLGILWASSSSRTDTFHGLLVSPTHAQAGAGGHGILHPSGLAETNMYSPIYQQVY